MAQEIKISANNKKLNKVLIELRDNYSLNLSFDDQTLSKYRITVNKNFSSPEKAFDFLIKGLPVAYENTNGVYIFYPDEKKQLVSKKYSLSGKITDRENNEALPYALIYINQAGTVSDEYGNFNFESKKDSIFQIKVSFLGYHILDTLIPAGNNYHLKLIPAVTKFKEIIIKGSPIVFSGQTGTKAGLIRINNRIAKYIPGSGDNAIFNLIRLQPGILASGEQSSEIIVWGSYEGQSQVDFDGITLFGLKNYNDNISPINPYIAKDIRINKGGYDATLGERVGGIVSITGLEGNRKKPAFKLNINNTTMNFLGELPIGKNNSLIAAFRQTYYQLYNTNQVSTSNELNQHMQGTSLIVQPDYTFKDANLKFSGHTKKGDTYSLSALAGQDKFYYSVNEQVQASNNMLFNQTLDERKLQYGASARYNKVWKGLGNSRINISYSNLQSDIYDKQTGTSMQMNGGMHSADSALFHNKEQESRNTISEFKTEITNKLRFSSAHELKFAAAYIYNNVLLIENNIADTNTVNLSAQGAQFMTYIQDSYEIIKNITFTAGLRTDYSINLNKTYFQPRINLAIKPWSKLQFNAAWGIYNQFIVKTAIVDENNNYRYLWMINNNEQIPVLTAQHYVLGSVFNHQGFTLSIEAFYKEIEGITRLITNDTQNQIYTGKSKIQGIDFFAKQEYKGHSFWISYTLSQSLEWFPFFPDNNYQAALQDQRHEIKLSGIFKLSPFYLSANYVYGSGFLQNTTLATGDNYPYIRLDIAGFYHFSIKKKIKLQTGISILNVLNRENIKYTNLIQVPTDGVNTLNVYSEAVPFTPTIFLNISF